MAKYAPRDETNPWAPETWNLTAQGAFIKRMVAQYGHANGMARAEAFAAQAGTTIGASRKMPDPKSRVVVVIQKNGPPGPPGPQGPAGDNGVTLGEVMALVG
jgi:hypothetical protein